MFEMLKKTFVILVLASLAAQAGASRSGAQAAYQDGLRKMKAKDYRNASVDFSFALSEDPAFDPALLQSAHCHYYLGEKEKALSEYTDYLAKHPEDSKLKAFVASLQQAAQASESETFGTGSDKCYLKGMEFMKVKNYKLAILCFVEGLGYDPRHYHAQRELGNAYYYSGDKKRALKAYEDYLKLKPQDAKVQGYVKALRKSGL